jgi:methyl-accepting chemotaxis protein
MALPIEFQLAFGIFRVPMEVNDRRRKIWELIAPELPAALDEHFRVTVENAPSFRKALTTDVEPYKQLIIEGTKRLFTRSFDDSWADDAVKRVDAEIALGFDMRSRPAVANTISCAINRILARKWMSRRAALALMDEAARVLALDASAAVTLHYTARVVKARARSTKLEHAIESFGKTVEEIRGAAGESVESLSDSAEELNQLADTASMQSSKAAAAADDTAVSASTMAAAADELTASIASIHEQATRSAQMAHSAAAQGGQINATVQSLADAVGRIGPVASLISEIAAQTNLLALNAAIEAARAGDAGKGFAVVAAEVKSLASQTSKATEDIGRQIAVIEEAMRRSVDEIKHGSDTATKIAGIVEAVAGAVDEQAAATQSIAQSAGRAAANATTVAEALKAIEATVQRTQETARAGLASTERMRTGTTRIGVAMDELFATAKDARLKSFHPLGKELDQKAG